MIRAILVALTLGLACTPSKQNVGADGEPQCVVCTQGNPFWRACRVVTVASGGQPVCDEDGRVVLCMSIKACKAAASSVSTQSKSAP